MDIIYLHGLKIECVIGVWEWERRIKQTITVDLDMAADIPRAAKSDALEDTLNYKAVAKRVIEYVGESQFRLIETLAERLAGVLQEEFAIAWFRLRVSKGPAVRGSRDVGIVLERGRKAD